MIRYNVKVILNGEETVLFEEKDLASGDVAMLYSHYSLYFKDNRFAPDYYTAKRMHEYLKGKGNTFFFIGRARIEVHPINQD